MDVVPSRQIDMSHDSNKSWALSLFTMILLVMDNVNFCQTHFTFLLLYFQIVYPFSIQFSWQFETQWKGNLKTHWNISWDDIPFSKPLHCNITDDSYLCPAVQCKDSNIATKTSSSMLKIFQRSLFLVDLFKVFKPQSASFPSTLRLPTETLRKSHKTKMNFAGSATFVAR